MNTQILTNRNGVEVQLVETGATIVSLLAPDREGRMADVVLGFNTLEDYAERSPYFGCVVGRFGNRIARGRFTLDGVDYALACNNEPGGQPCHLHGGPRGFDKVRWTSSPETRNGVEGFRFDYRSPHGEEGYPGTLDAAIWYGLDETNALRIEYTATADRATPVNLTNHTYFNLKGEGAGDILDHELQISASRATPVDAGLIPTGEIVPVAGTPLDFTRPRRIGERIDADHEQLRFGGGYDHNWVLDHAPGELALAASVYEPESGRALDVLTTEPGVQFYSGNFLDGTLRGKSGALYPRRGGFCLETQHFPDSPNHPHFPTTILRPGETLQSTTVFRFHTR